MRFDVTSDLRAATLLSALGLDPRQVMRDLGAQDPFGLNLLGDGFDRVGNFAPGGLANLMRLGALQQALGMPGPLDQMGRFLRGYPEQQEQFEPRDFPRGSTGRQLAKLFRSDPFARQQLERILGGRIIPSSLNPSGFTVQRFAPGAFPGGGNMAALQAYSMLSGIDRGAAMFNAGAQFGQQNAFQTMMMGAFGMMAAQQGQRLADIEQRQRRRNFRILDTADLLGINPDGTPKGGTAQAFSNIPGFGAIPGLGGGGGLFGGGGGGGLGDLLGGFGSALGGGGGLPTQGAFGIGDGFSDTNAVMGSGALTVEDKVTLLIMMIMKKMDQDIERQANYINSLQQQQQGGGGKGGKGGKGGAGGGAPSIDVETMKLKRLIDKRSQMFDMLRQIIDKYNQTAKGIIDSMGR